MWFSLAKMAVSTGAKVYANKQRQKEAMSQAALLTAEKMKRRRGEKMSPEEKEFLTKLFEKSI